MCQRQCCKVKYVCILSMNSFRYKSVKLEYYIYPNTIQWKKE